MMPRILSVIAPLLITVSALASEKDLTGEEVFAKHCSTCHGDAGAGSEPWFPALTRLAALRSSAEIIETILTGRFNRGGEISGHTIPIMPAWGQLSNADVAAVVNFIKNTWGDDGAHVSVTQVAEIREELWKLD